ncbi:hypothetical protein WJX79_006525 [Trebouxia sp. C0005]
MSHDVSLQHARLGSRAAFSKPLRSRASLCAVSQPASSWDKLYHSLAQPAAPNLWRPLSDGSDRIFPQYGLRLQGEVWYQGEEALDTGRLYADQNGVIERQTIKLCPGVADNLSRRNMWA